MLDLTNTEAQSGKPSGLFNVRISEVKEKTSKNNDKYISMKLIIVGKKFAKFPVFEIFMLAGKGKDMGMGKLADLMDKSGLGRKIDSYDEFLGKMIGVKLREDKEGNVRVDAYTVATEDESSEEL